MCSILGSIRIVRGSKGEMHVLCEPITLVLTSHLFLDALEFLEVQQSQRVPTFGTPS